VSFGSVWLVAHQLAGNRVVSAGLRLADPDPAPVIPRAAPAKRLWRQMLRLPGLRHPHDRVD
jgi:hypothetical protein